MLNLLQEVDSIKQTNHKNKVNESCKEELISDISSEGQIAGRGFKQLAKQ